MLRSTHPLGAAVRGLTVLCPQGLEGWGWRLGESRLRGDTGWAWFLFCVFLLWRLQTEVKLSFATLWYLVPSQARQDSSPA